jgi:hypothetical protein
MYNVAAVIKSSQVSTHEGADAGRAVDGNTNQVHTAGSCTHTDSAGSTNPWWTVDLGETFDIHRLKIYNRGDCCGTCILSITSTTTEISVYIDIDNCT